MSVRNELRKQVKLFLSFSAGERIATLILFSVLLVVLGIMYLLPYVVKQPSPEDALQIIATWEAEKAAEKSKKRFAERRVFNSTSDSATQAVPVQLFLFNPNTISEEQAKTLGFTARQIKNVFNYRSKGGVFRKKSDLSKLYSFDSASYARLKPYIDLPDSVIRSTAREEKRFNVNAPRIIELNGADSVTLVELKGIGPYTASRIIRYRNRLGGFVSPQQLKEVWGVTDSLYQIILPQISINTSLVQKIQVNSATAEILRQHPYIWKWPIARAIVNYREQHGRYKTYEDLKPIVLLHDTTITKLQPYLNFD